ncbi:MAG: type II toxin-antitoxin system VapC family toxin [Bacteroidales bacterium]|nr:type II toxin-antitoxin system VapC family toxin [Bacteroidales bacterium]
MVSISKIKRTNRIYIDANVLINYCTGQPNDCSELKWLFSSKCDDMLYTSNLAIVQTIAKLQTANKYRKALLRTDIEKFINYFYSHITVCEVSNNIIKQAMNLIDGDDLEDNIHYLASQSVNCNIILTNNKKDFLPFNINIRTPRRLKYA